MATKADETKISDVRVTVSLAPGLAAYLKAWADRHGETLGQLVRKEIEQQQYNDLEDLRGADLLGGIFPGIDRETDSWIARNYPKKEKTPEGLVSASRLSEAEAKIAEYEKLFDIANSVTASDVEVTVTLAPALAAYLAQWGKGRGESLAQAIRTTVEDDVYSFIDNDDGADILNSLVPGISDEVSAWHKAEYPSEAKDPETR